VKAWIWFRMTAVLFILFGAGHTFGFLSFRPSSPVGLKVWNDMRTIRFAEGHTTFSYRDFYIGFGLFISLFDVFLAWLAWHLAAMSKKISPDASNIAWAMVALQLIGFGLSWRFFAVGPAVFSALAAFTLLACALAAAKSPPSFP
jgi:hypothetical protein